MTLEPGDIISTGTPAGVAMSMNTPKYLKDGDLVEISIEKLGTIRNKVIFIDKVKL
jgi:2-keto-4-pentenoate hydratase/2-oxohepta-3-ene-1,7-dioic acid hydratase in catechol pathway